jgi:FkbM family methyltransferase
VLKRWVVGAPVGTIRYWITLVTVVSRLASGRRMHAKMFVLGLLMPLRDRLVGPRDTRLRLRYRGLCVPWTVGPKSDLDVLNELLVLRVYGAQFAPIEPSSILDLGSHMGASILFWRERFPEARIVGVEPDPVTFRRLRVNVGSWPGVELHNVAVAEKDGPTRFFSARQGWISSLSGEGQPVVSSGRSFRGLVEAIGYVDLLKVDVEGAEWHVLDDRALQRVGAIIGEYHDTGDQDARERFFLRLRRHFDLTVGPPAPLIAFCGSRAEPRSDTSTVEPSVGGS